MKTNEQKGAKTSMLALGRQNEIMDILKKDKSVQVSTLAKQFFTCESTIRRDLEILEKKHLVRRTYGGAMLLEGLNTEFPFDVRMRERQEEKSHIGRIAADYVHDGDTIIIDSSSTAYHMLKFLKDRQDLTIITNGLRIATAAGSELHCRVYCTGGMLRENSSSIVGTAAEAYVSGHRVQKLFFSCRAFSSDCRVMDLSDEEAALRRAMIDSAEEVYLLCDDSKIGKTAFSVVCEAGKIDGLITDQQPAAPICAALERAGVTVQY